MVKTRTFEPRSLLRVELKSLLDGLIRDFKTFGPTEIDGVPAFSGLGAYADLRLDLIPTHLSAREFLQPPKERLLDFDLTDKKKSLANTAVIEAPEQVLVGLKPCDINALKLMDMVMEAGVPDVNYLHRRANTVVIGADCMPDKDCFCTSVGTDRAEDGFDLFIHLFKRGVVVRVGTSRGIKLLKKYGAWGRRASKVEKVRIEKFYEQKANAFTARLKCVPEELPGIFAASDESPVWNEIGNICTGCGSCNHVCPTCYCFDIQDELSTDLKSGARFRVWDGCTLDDFTLVAGGHNFRKSRAERLRHRFNRKFNYGAMVYGSLFCVGCGRCSRTCLVGINITEVANSIIEEVRGKSGEKT